MVRGTTTYAITSILQRSLGFLLLPVYTRVLDPAEYGQIGIIATVSAAIGTVLALGLETAIFRTWVQLRERPIDQKRFVNTVGSFGLAFPVATAVVLTLPIGLLGESAFGTPAAGLGLGLLAAGLNAALTVVPFALLRAEERFRDYLRLSGLQAILGTALTLLFVVAFKWGVVGWMLATAIAAGTVLTVGIATVRHQWSRQFDARLLRSALAFGIPLVPHAASHWGLALSDRAVLGSLLPTSEVGVYHLAYQFSIPVTVIAVALSQSAQPLFAEAGSSPDRRLDIERVTTQHVAIVAILTLAVALLGPSAVYAILPSGYADAATYVPWIALGALFFGMYLVPMNAIAVLAGKSRWVWLVTITAAATNVTLNLALVPRLGALAAAINTAVGYGVLLIGVYAFMLLSVRPHLRFEWGRILGSLSLIAAVAAAGFALPASVDWAAQAIARGAMLFLATVVLVYAGILPSARLLVARLARNR